jgi:hypothetical protein
MVVLDPAAGPACGNGGMSEWQDIETAPRDGTSVDLWVSAPPQMISTGAGRVTDCWFFSGKWWRYDGQGDEYCRSEVANATHWMPLPEHPKP